jgi:hypothetical protein
MEERLMSKVEFPTAEIYRDVKIFAFQSQNRIENVVRPAIDEVYSTHSALELKRYVENRKNPPEARLFAYARICAIYELSAEQRIARPPIDLTSLKFFVIGLDNLASANPEYFSSIWDYAGNQAERREWPLDKDKLLGRTPRQ